MKRIYPILNTEDIKERLYDDPVTQQENEKLKTDIEKILENNFMKGKNDEKKN